MSPNTVLFLGALILSLTNPKAILFYVSVRTVYRC